MSGTPPVGFDTTYLLLLSLSSVNCAVYSYEQFALVLIPGLRYWTLSAFARAVPKFDESSWLTRSFIKYLEKIGSWDRTIEFLPSDEELASRKAAGRALHLRSGRCYLHTARSR